ncbi:hypothetical protein HNQ91_002697 [Filimonas zeae]|nr:glycosyl hydrolase [Filimonas zeae]MDR6339632.1 hypothetical protein [Filimonas zeae]
MRNFLLLWVVMACLCTTGNAQTPVLPVKGTLSNTLFSSRTFTNATQVDTVMKPVTLPASYTLEVTGRVNAAAGRGLDIEARNASFKGFRLSMGASGVSNTASLNSPQALSVFPAATQQTLRIAVKNDSAFYYHNGAFIQAGTLADVKDIVNGAEVNDPVVPVKDTAVYLTGWAGVNGNNSGTPADYGWAYNGTTNTGLFTIANNTAGVRYMDVTTTANTHTYNGAAWTGRAMYVRWDGSDIANACYTYPVTLQANTTYTFSMLQGYVSNATGGKTLTVGVGKTTAASARFASQSFTPAGTKNLVRSNFTFTTQEAGTYYLSITGTWGLYSIGELQLKATNLIANWAGTDTSKAGSPATYGWALTGTTTALFNTANSGSGVRYMDVTTTANTHTYNNSAWTGRVLYLRWDNSAITGACYSYPVTLEANTTYDFTMLHSYVSNATGSKYITAGIGKTTSAADRLATHTFSPEGTKALKRESFLFTSQEAGVYYLTFTGSWALYSVADLSVTKAQITPRFLFGKNYASGAVNMDIASVTYDEGAYAPSSVLVQTKQNTTITDSIAFFPSSVNINYIVPGKTDLHLTGDFSPLVNSTVQLNSNDAWLFLDNVKPSTVTAGMLSNIYINGVSASGNTSARIAIYKNGTVIIPNGNVTSQAALQVYTQASLGGSSRTMEIQTYHNNLGAFDNAIRSFVLKRGYSATFATNADGSGYSRVFVANDRDLVVNVMPEGLVATTSFIRVFKWDWVSKKGWAGGGNALDKVNATWYYDWNIAGQTTSNQQYAIIRQHGGWPSWTDIGNKQNVNHLLGFNEPDRPDQANMTIEEALSQWPEMMKSGLRIGSPAPSNPNSWLYNFISKCDSLNYRVDYVAIHCYWNSRTPEQWYSGLKAVYDQVKRPLWITEWNNGANWTGEAWPSTVPEQQAKQLADLQGILRVLDTCSFVERYSIYNWVEDKRAMILADTLTPAGRYYAANKSDFAYNPQKAFTHTWKLVAAPLSGAIDTSDYFRVRLSWRDLNGELGGKYVLERKRDGIDADFTTVQEFTGYTAGSTLTYTDSVYSKATYRVKAYNTALSASVYSALYEVLRDNAPQAPASLTGTALASTKNQLNWTAAATARSYNLKRSLSASGPFATIAARTTGLSFADDNLTPSTNYYYVVTSLNSAGESVNSTVLTLRTKDLVAPAGVVNPRVASGDGRVTLTWDFMYDASYNILRSATVNGTYSTIATNVNTVRYVDTYNISNNSTYYYKLVAYNAAGSSPQTAALTATPKAGQHLHLNFNENTGTFAEDTWGAFHGSLQNSAVWASGQNDAAVQLVKASSSYVGLPAGVVSELNNFTIAAWVKLPANQGNNTRLFDFGNGTGTFMVLVPKIDQTVRYKITCPAGTYDRYIPYAVPLDSWVHLTISQSGNVFKLYANGVLQYTDSGATVKPSDMGVTAINYLGRSQFPADPYSDHIYDDFRIYNYALNAADIATLAASSTALVTNTQSAAPAFAGTPDMEIQVYPNPASSVVYLSGLKGKAGSYTLYNNNGAAVAQGVVQQNSIVLPASITNGVYFLQLYSGNSLLVRKRVMVLR